MKTVKDMIKELKKFPPEAKCFAYEGECVGLSIFSGSNSNSKWGFIFCGEKGKDAETETIEKDLNK